MKSHQFETENQQLSRHAEKSKQERRPSLLTAVSLLCLSSYVTLTNQSRGRGLPVVVKTSFLFIAGFVNAKKVGKGHGTITYWEKLALNPT